MPYEEFDTQNSRCDFAGVSQGDNNKIVVIDSFASLQYHLIIVTIVTIFILMPITDISVIGTLIITLYALIQLIFLIPYMFLDTFLFHYYSRYGDTGL